jgi:phospholipase/carboxylesterase
MSDSSTPLEFTLNEPTLPSSGNAPLLVLLHGVGSNEEDLMGLARFLDGRFLIASLRAPLTIQDGAYGWYELEWTTDGINHDEEGAIAGQAAAETAIDRFVKSLDVDPARVYIMGFSQGAIMSLGIALSHPEKIAGAVIMSGRLLPHVAAKAASPDLLAGLPVMVVHGTADPVLPIELGRQINDFLKQTPVDLTYREYLMGHTVSQESLLDITQWLTEQLDKPLAK